MTKYFIVNTKKVNNMRISIYYILYIKSMVLFLSFCHQTGLFPRVSMVTAIFKKSF
nr:MAG TPA: hypothetical protein [Caudoviricetes sp.]